MNTPQREYHRPLYPNSQKHPLVGYDDFLDTTMITFHSRQPKFHICPRQFLVLAHLETLGPHPPNLVSTLQIPVIMLILVHLSSKWSPIVLEFSGDTPIFQPTNPIKMSLWMTYAMPLDLPLPIAQEVTGGWALVLRFHH